MFKQIYAYIASGLELPGQQYVIQSKGDMTKHDLTWYQLIDAEWHIYASVN